MEINSWFEATVAIDQMQDDGITKAVTQKYLLDALSFKEAEDRIIDEMKPFTSGNLEVKAVKRVRIMDIVQRHLEAQKWYRIKAVFIVIDEKTCAEKETVFVMMVQSDSIKDAIADFEKGMEGSMMDFRIVNVAETKIVDVYQYLSKKGDNEK